MRQPEKSDLTAILALLIALPIGLMAQQPPGLHEFNQASTALHDWYFSLSNLILVLAAIAGLCGGLRIYAIWNIGHRHHVHMDAQVIGWLLSCLFLTLVSGFLRALYGV
jgi:succinate dehydrogenase/fumarate reductase cytochrome b subunit